MRRDARYLQELQSLPLDLKVMLTRQRIREAVSRYGVDGLYVSFSGGKDSTVLLDIVRKDYPDIPAVFIDTGLEYPEIRSFVKIFDNVEWIKPKKNFRQVILDYGYPVISKEVSERVYYAQKYLEWYRENGDENEEPTSYSIKKFLNMDKNEKVPDEILVELAQTEGATLRVKQLAGLAKDGDKKSSFNYNKWLFLMAAPFMISNKCCDVMKKSPAHAYSVETGRIPITAQMAEESRLRKQKWIQNGCNAFNSRKPVSNPLSFWTENDVLQYIVEQGGLDFKTVIDWINENGGTDIRY